VWRVSSFFRPFEDSQLAAIAVNHNPADRIIAILATDFASIFVSDQEATSVI
jgi:hypothetical protein